MLETTGLLYSGGAGWHKCGDLAFIFSRGLYHGRKHTASALMLANGSNSIPSVNLRKHCIASFEHRPIYTHAAEFAYLRMQGYFNIFACRVVGSPNNLTNSYARFHNSKYPLTVSVRFAKFAFLQEYVKIAS